MLDIYTNDLKVSAQNVIQIVPLAVRGTPYLVHRLVQIIGYY